MVEDYDGDSKLRTGNGAVKTSAGGASCAVNDTGPKCQINQGRMLVSMNAMWQAFPEK